MSHRLVSESTLDPQVRPSPQIDQTIATTWGDNMVGHTNPSGVPSPRMALFFVFFY